MFIIKNISNVDRTNEKNKFCKNATFFLINLICLKRVLPWEKSHNCLLKNVFECFFCGIDFHLKKMSGSSDFFQKSESNFYNQMIICPSGDVMVRVSAPCENGHRFKSSVPVYQFMYHEIMIPVGFKSLSWLEVVGSNPAGCVVNYS